MGLAFEDGWASASQDVKDGEPWSRGGWAFGEP